MEVSARHDPNLGEHAGGGKCSTRNTGKPTMVRPNAQAHTQFAEKGTSATGKVMTTVGPLILGVGLPVFPRVLLSRSLSKNINMQL